MALLVVVKKKRSCSSNEDLATYFRDNMTGKVRFELSNEIWNFQFVQAGYFAAQATAQWGLSGGTTWLSAAGKRLPR